MRDGPLGPVPFMCLGKFDGHGNDGLLWPQLLGYPKTKKTSTENTLFFFELVFWKLIFKVKVSCVFSKNAAVYRGWKATSPEVICFHAE